MKEKSDGNENPDENEKSDGKKRNRQKIKHTKQTSLKYRKTILENKK